MALFEMVLDILTHAFAALHFKPTEDMYWHINIVKSTPNMLVKIDHSSVDDIYSV